MNRIGWEGLALRRVGLVAVAVLALLVGGLMPVTADAASSAAGLAAALPAEANQTSGSGQSVWAWGNNEYGQLGINSTTDSLVPVPVPGLPDVTSITIGGYSVYALAVDGTLWAWGNNDHAQLGINTSTAGRFVPVQVPGLTDVTSITNNGSSGYALDADGTVWAWGSNNSGKLGINSTTNSLVPVQVPGLTDVTSITTHNHSVFALTADGTVWSWGYNSYGQLGIGSTTDSHFPVQVPGLTDVTSITTVSSAAFALEADGTVWAWGNNSYGQLGIGSTTNSLVPVQVPGLTGVISVTTTGGSVFAFDANGTVWAWGLNSNGQLGNGSTTNCLVPVQVPGLTGVTSINVESGIFALDADGTLWAWGPNSNGQLGIGSTTDSLVPVRVSGLTDITSIVAGQFALDADGTVWAWGNNVNGLLGNGSTTDSLVPVQVPGLAPVTSFTSASGAAFAIVDAPDYGVGVVVAGGGSFGSVKAGGTVPAARTVTVKNVGIRPTGDLTVALSGGGASAFMVSSSTLGSVPVGGKATFTVAPRLGLKVGSYVATLTVSGANGISQTVPVSFEVTAVPTGPPAGGSSPGQSGAGGDKPGAIAHPDAPVKAELKSLRTSVKSLYVKKGKTLRLPVIADPVSGKEGPVELTVKVAKTKQVNVSVGGRKIAKSGRGTVTVTPDKPLTVKVKGVEAGKASVTLTAANGVKVKVKVQVVKKAQAAKSLTVNAKGLKKKAGKYTLNLKRNQTVDLTVKPSPAKQTSAVATFKAKGAVKVDAAGRVTAIKKGKAKVTVKLGRHKTVINTTVK